MVVSLEGAKSSDRATETDLVIRGARPDEAARVAALILQSFAEFENEVPAAVWEVATAEWTDVLGRWQEAELIVAERDGDLLGAVTFYPEGSLSRTEAWPPGWAALRIFCVSPRARRQGVGSALTQECIRRARERGIATIGLKTGLFMVAARAVYEKAGFVRDPELDHYWTGNGVVAEADQRTTVPALAYRMDLA
jgi:ribosomal protein S18 acetylase RimI-like enzyme